MRTRSLRASAMLLVFLAALHAESKSVRLSGARSITLPAAIEYPFDVRWKTDATVLVAAGRSGVLEVDLERPGATNVEIPGGGLPSVTEGEVRSFFFSALLGYSAGNVMTGSPFLAFAWKLNGQQPVDVPYANIVDFDIHEERAVVLGVRGNAEGHWGSVGSTLSSARFVGTRTHFDAMAGPDTERMRACHILQLGAVRFTPDGRTIVAPGVVPDVQLFDRRGRLIRTWRTAGLGYQDGCGLSFEQSEALADITPRQQWRNRRQLLDELVVLPEGPVLIIRQPAADGTRWRGILLPYDGAPVALSIPVSSPSPHAHIKGDVRNNRVVFSVYEATGPGQKRVDRPRLVLCGIER